MTHVNQKKKKRKKNSAQESTQYGSTHADARVYLAVAAAHARVSAVVAAAHARPILPPPPPVARSAQPSFVAPAFTGIYNLIYPFLQSVPVAQSVLVECLCFY